MITASENKEGRISILYVLVELENAEDMVYNLSVWVIVENIVY